MKRMNQRNREGTNQRKQTRLLWALVIVFVGYQFLSFHPPPVPWQLATTNNATIRTMDDDQVNDDHDDNDLELDKAPYWSAYRFQHHRPEFNATWHLIANTDDPVDPKRYATEALVYGLAGVLPYYAFQLPAIWFESPFGSPFSDKTRVHVIHVPQVTDAFLDLQHCKAGRPNFAEQDGIINEPDRIKTKPDGTYDACFPNATGRDIAREYCFSEETLDVNTRVHLYPAPGHERWLCNDTAILEQLAAMQVMDYLISHTDRFYEERTNNLFFLRNSEPKQFVHLDHDAHICDFYKPMDKWMEYHLWVDLHMLQDYDLPLLLQENIRTALSSKKRFATILDATMNGQLHAVSAVLEYSFVKRCPGKPMSKHTLDMVWDRLISVARFYKLYNSSTMEEPRREDVIEDIKSLREQLAAAGSDAEKEAVQAAINRELATLTRLKES